MVRLTLDGHAFRQALYDLGWDKPAWDRFYAYLKDRGVIVLYDSDRWTDAQRAWVMAAYALKQGDGQ